MLKRNKLGALRAVELEVAGECIRAATWPLNIKQNVVLIAGWLLMEKLRAVGIADAEIEADAAALAGLWGKHLPLREQLQEMRHLILEHFLIERRSLDGSRLGCDAATLRALPTLQRHALVLAILQDMETKRAQKS